MDQAKISVIILAAGKASRMGQLKQLLEWRGKPLIVHVIDNILMAGLKEIVVVVGYQGERVRQALATYSNLRIVENPNFAKGQSESLKVGIEFTETLNQKRGFELQGVMIALADQPSIGPEIYKQVAEKYLVSKLANKRPIIIPTFREKRGNPVLFDKFYFKDLKHIQGDQGGRALMENYIANICYLPVDAPEILKDVDNQEDYKALGD